jgi:hypothetical protein
MTTTLFQREARPVEVSFTVEDGAFDPLGGTALFMLFKAPAQGARTGAAALSVSGAVSAVPAGGFAFTADISAAQSSALTAGLYSAHLEITKAADVRVVDLGQIKVGAHPAPA